jgi:hypothetical protein
MYAMKQYQKKILVFAATTLLVLTCSNLWAHASMVDLEKMSPSALAILYLQLGFEHIVPMGLDHILFVLSLFLLSPTLKPILWQATAFTIAHTVTLGLSMYQIINPPAQIVEPLIALSILYVAVENMVSRQLRTSRLVVVFLFGLVHGMGFAGALGQLGLPQSSYFSSLLLFNLGVELGQILVIVLAWFLLAKWFGNKAYYRKLIVMPLSMIIGIISVYWIIERLFF